MSLRRVAVEAGVRTDVKEYCLVPGGKAYEVEVDADAATYILDTDSGLRLACEPELVGSKMEREAVRAAQAVVSLISKLCSSKKVLFLHLLRASRGYGLHYALRSGGFEVKEVSVRVAYAGSTIGTHEGREAKVVYSNLAQVSGDDSVLVLADTVATGQTVNLALDHLFKEAELRGARIREVHVYGFLSEPGVKRVGEFLKRMDVSRVYFYALQDLTALSSNNYDMPLYGPDLPSFRSHGLSSLGGVAAEETLDRMLPYYFPGMDQPGDWSERQCSLFNGEGYEKGRIVDHLERSLLMLEELHDAVRAYPWFREWMEEVYLTRKRRLLDVLSRADFCET